MSNELLIAIHKGAFRAALTYDQAQQDAEDTAQDVLLRFMESKKPPQFSDLDKAERWGYKTARNLIFSRHRMNKLTFICFDFVRNWGNI